MEQTHLTVAQAAKLKSVSRTTIYNAINRGELVPEELLGKTALRRSDVEAWAAPYRAGRRTGATLSLEARQRISESQKRRWGRRK